MLQTMENYTFLNRISTLVIALLLVSCNPSEPKLELQLKKQAIGTAFTFADYCENKYDSIYIIQPYEDEELIYSLPYKMSNRLRGICSYTLDDTFVRILFIDKDTVKAYTETGNWSAYFSTSEIINHGPEFSFKQRFILDEERYVHLYEEGYK